MKELNNNLLEVSFSRKKGIENESRILDFLKKEKYSTSNIIKTVIGIKTKSAICRILKRMKEKGYIKRHDVNRYRVLWGITNEGLHHAYLNSEKVSDWQYFEPSKINVLTLDHQLDIQKIHSFCSVLGLGFKTGRELGSRSQNDKIPDGVIYFGDHKVALEVERHIKSKRRYDAVIYNYLKLIKSGEYYSVLYVSDTREVAEKVRKAIHSIEKITMKVGGLNKSLQLTDAHRSYFDFVSISDAYNFLEEFKRDAA